MDHSFTPTAPVKLVIWDLDDTFWAGTLSEGGITHDDGNAAIVRTLVDRGIMSSIVSKNELEPVRQELMKAGLWDLFIFPRVSWNAKGSQIADILEQANLRPDNVLFIDDNTINLEEARFRFPTMMIGHPDHVLPGLLDRKELAGKDDRQHSRLKQYKQLEQKAVDQAQSPLSNVDFLRQCDIRIRYDFDIAAHMPRIIELINRSNQLNYTKRRLEDKQAVVEFQQQLARHDMVAAAIFASDRYGTHGLIGFYLQQRTERVNKLIHYVWSCRMMNAGLEQFVYTQLGRPEIEVVGPVSNPIEVFETVDWIEEVQQDERGADGPAPHLLLIGSCDLTAVSSYCSPDREEYVNGVNRGVMTRYDDFGFILSDPVAVQNSRVLPQLPVWSREDFAAFHAGLAASDVIIVSLSAALKGAYLLTRDGVVARVHPEGLGHHVDFAPRTYPLKGAARYLLEADANLGLLHDALDLIDRRALTTAAKFLLGTNTRGPATRLGERERAVRQAYNATCSDFCRTHQGWHFVSVDELVSEDKLSDDRHYHRMGYVALADHIKQVLATAKLVDGSDAGTVRAPSDIAAVVARGRRIGRLHKLGVMDGRWPTQAKQALKLLPFIGLARRGRGMAEAG